MGFPGSETAPFNSMARSGIAVHPQLSEQGLKGLSTYETLLGSSPNPLDLWREAYLPALHRFSSGSFCSLYSGFLMSNFWSGWGHVPLQSMTGRSGDVSSKPYVAGHMPLWGDDIGWSGTHDPLWKLTSRKPEHCRLKEMEIRNGKQVAHVQQGEGLPK